MSFIRHIPAFAGQISTLYHLKPGDLFLDLTLGDGGHSQEALESGARVVSLDVDLESIDRATNFLSSKFSPIIVRPEMKTEIPTDFKWLIVYANFKNIGKLKEELNLPLFNGIIADLGTSQYQLLSPERGFSFNLPGPLDMRLDARLGVSASDLINVLSGSELEQLLRLVDEYQARPIVKAIVTARKIVPITTTDQLSRIVASAKRTTSEKINPATKTFMALRMAVNLERESLREMLVTLPNLLLGGGTMGIISFHSGEDRLAKHFIKDQVKAGILRVINVKPIIPTPNELHTNPKIRSAKLRLAQKI
ncbi:16S rRNA (cytosine(1402)-N(4))-methyltransferase RsmH [Candidatus Collierbacteria bacterium]|nr:16S rRNA (cytosine(1402)-N(4))-methyltransferase RsmH [Candidatus Collierbacteria bacterium]